MSKQRGQSIVELALMLPILLIILLGLLDLGRAYYVVVTLKDMAAEGANYAAIYPNDEIEIQERAAAGSGGLVRVDPSAVQVQYPPEIEPGQPITVTVSYSFTFVTPFVRSMFENATVDLHGMAANSIISAR